jgi:hypothetical protein|tara:strand:- start:557 stop:739 length:183 start_codon:yes stop_codon:yes gene_type:complete
MGINASLSIITTFPMVLPDESTPQCDQGHIYREIPVIEAKVLPVIEMGLNTFKKGLVVES